MYNKRMVGHSADSCFCDCQSFAIGPSVSHTLPKKVRMSLLNKRWLDGAKEQFVYSAVADLVTITPDGISLRQLCI